MEDNKLTEGEACALYALTRCRIDTLKKKTQRRLAMTAQEKEFFAGLRQKLKNDSLYSQLFSTFLESGILEMDMTQEESKIVERLQNDLAFRQEYLASLGLDSEEKE